MNFEQVSNTKAKVCKSWTKLESELYKKFQFKALHNAKENIISNKVTIHSKNDWIIIFGSNRTKDEPCRPIFIPIDIV